LSLVIGHLSLVIGPLVGRDEWADDPGRSDQSLDRRRESRSSIQNL